MEPKFLTLWKPINQYFEVQTQCLEVIVKYISHRKMLLNGFLIFIDLLDIHYLKDFTYFDQQN